jgi:hypothetical protein
VGVKKIDGEELKPTSERCDEGGVLEIIVALVRLVGPIVASPPTFMVGKEEMTISRDGKVVIVVELGRVEKCALINALVEGALDDNEDGRLLDMAERAAAVGSIDGREEGKELGRAEGYRLKM